MLLTSGPIVTVDTNFGAFQIELRPDAAPQTVANFLAYVESGAYTDSIFHRSVPGFVEQAGGFTSSSATFSGDTTQFSTIPTKAPVPLEYDLPNIVGSVAMARTSDPNSATDEWFVNLVDNTSTLGPASDGSGYTVFGQVIGNGMQVLNAIAALSVDKADNGGTFGQLPLGASSQLVQISSVTIDSIDGTVFSDTNANGQLDAGEQGVAARTMFIDEAGTGVFQSGDPAATTDSTGHYSFSGLAPGTYQVFEQSPAGAGLTNPSQPVVVAANDTASADFAETPAITGVVFADANGNGVKDAGETGIAGRTVFLNNDGSGAPDANNPSTTTDANGNYSFSGLTAGTYTVGDVVPAGTTVTTTNLTVTVASGGTSPSLNIGEMPPSLAGTVFTDANDNGQFDAGDAGVVGRTVFIDQDGSGQADGINPQTTTDSLGQFTFSGLAAGSYTIEEVPPSGAALTTPVQTATVTVGQTASGIVFGEQGGASASGTATISGTVFNDIDVNGRFDPGEPGLAGRVVFLDIDGSGQADGTNPQTTTDANGDFSFSAVAAGNQTVMQAVSANHGVTLTTSAQAMPITAGQNVSGVEIGDALTSTLLPMQLSTAGPTPAADADTAYINAVFQSVLGHAPDAVGLAYWQQQMAAGQDRSAVAQGVWDSTEHRGDEVEQFYQEFLDRASDAQGKAFWIAAFNDWGTEQIEVAGFLTSAEYMNLHAGNTGFVDALYNDVDLRPADLAGESYWTSQLNGGEDPVQVAFAFIYGQEASTAVVDSFYSDFLHRTPDSGDLQMWIGDLSQRTLTAEQVGVQILAADEYFKNVTGNNAPSITSAASASFTEDSAATFTVSTTGAPAAAINETGSLPGGLTFKDNGDGTATISGAADAGTAGSYQLQITASNSLSPDATQTLTLTVHAVSTAPAITSAASAGFTEGSASTFTVNTSGSPAATITESGSLPSGLTFTNNGDGTATISGTPDAGTAQSYSLQLAASNGVSPDASQTFTLTVHAAQEADLSIANTDDSSTPGSAVPGTSLTYTIVVTNAGPSDVTGASVTDALPVGFTGAAFTATETGGASGFTAGGSGNISDTVDMPVGSTITYVVTGTIDPAATGTLSNTATVAAPAGATDANPANNSATDNDTLTP